MGLVLVLAAGVLLSVSAGEGQQNTPQVPTRPLIVPNRTMDAQELNELAQKNAKKKNFDAANEERKRVIDDEANKLLILARDLKTKTDNLGGGTLPPTLVREAEVIQLLGSDVKEKMKLTVNSD